MRCSVLCGSVLLSMQSSHEGLIDSFDSAVVLPSVAACCSVLQCVAVCCIVCVASPPEIGAYHLAGLSASKSMFVKSCVAVCCNVLQRVAVYCSVLQCVAVCCSALQFVAVCCKPAKWGLPCGGLKSLHAEVFQAVSSFPRRQSALAPAVCWSVLQCVAVCCSECLHVDVCRVIFSKDNALWPVSMGHF